VGEDTGINEPDRGIWEVSEEGPDLPNLTLFYMNQNSVIDWNVFAVILAISILHLLFALVLYFLLRLNTLSEIPFEFMVDGFLVISFLAQVLVLGILIFIGLYLGKSVGLGAPLLGSWTKGEPVRERVISALKVSLLLGIGIAATKYLLDQFIFSQFLPATLSGWKQIPLFLAAAIPFQQGIGDEISYRLFWMTVLVWVTYKIQGPENESVKAMGIWASILIVGLFSILGPPLWGTAILVKLQYAVLILTGSIPFGWLYWKKGIESALLAHFSSSVVLLLLSFV